MFSNYLKLAWRVLGRNKFFTFISLFGISFTLAVLMLIVSYLQTELGNNQPWTHKEDMVLLTNIRMEDVQPDTTQLIDSSLIGGLMTYDTSYTYGEEAGSVTISNLGERFLLDHFTALPSADNYTFYTPNHSFNAYVNNSKISLKTCYTDERFWEVLDFEFIEGQGFLKAAFDQAEPVAIITDNLAEKYFGKSKNILGEELKMDGTFHKIIGVIKKPSSSLLVAEVFAPVTLLKNYPGAVDEFRGGANAIFLAKKGTGTEQLKKDIVFQATQISMDIIPDYNTLILKGKTLLETFSQNLIYMDDPEDSKKWVLGILIGLISLFVLLPTLNLINLNVSRILERSSEIGVRKAFGASKWDILSQFVFENVVLTLIGGFIGFLIAIGLISFINSTGYLEGVQLQLNWRFFVISLLTILFFGIVSGLLPAAKMSKIHIVNALNEKAL